MDVLAKLWPDFRYRTQPMDRSREDWNLLSIFVVTVWKILIIVVKEYIKVYWEATYDGVHLNDLHLSLTSSALTTLILITVEVLLFFGWLLSSKPMICMKEPFMAKWHLIPGVLHYLTVFIHKLWPSLLPTCPGVLNVRDSGTPLTRH